MQKSLDPGETSPEEYIHGTYIYGSGNITEDGWNDVGAGSTKNTSLQGRCVKKNKT